MEPTLAKKQKENWQKQTFLSFDQDKNAQVVFLENPELNELTMWTLFEKVVSPVIELLLHETNQYTTRDKNKPQFKVTLEKLKIFIGLIFLSGYKITLVECDYWSADPDLRCNTICERMGRKRFFKVKSFLHAADNQSLSESRMAKVEPLYDLLNKKNHQFGIAHEDLSIYEYMVSYCGRHSCK